MFLTKRKNGNWSIIYVNEFGKRTKISTQTKLKSEAHKYLAEFSKQLEERKSRAHKYIGLKSFRYTYLKHSASIHRPKSTMLIKGIYNDFQKYFKNPLLHEITFQNIQDYINYKRKVSVYTAQKHLVYLRSAFNYAIKNNYITKNHFKDIPTNQLLRWTDQGRSQ